MMTKCERAAGDVLPRARALIARKLVDVYGLSRTEAAKRMGLTQPAISQYVKETRGRGQAGEKGGGAFEALATEVAKGVAEGTVTAESMGAQMCRFCVLAEGGRGKAR
jgi:predicted transcriptional regulator